MRIGCFLIALLFGSCAGVGGAALSHIQLPPGFQTASGPMPHFAPKYKGGVSLRYAMVHDVIHERFPVHGPAYYRERDRQARERLKVLPADSQEAFDLTDDLAVGLDRLGRPADGVPLLREKLARHEEKGLGGRFVYTTYANLGTLLIHANLKAALTGNATAKVQAAEGLEFVLRSIAVNPEAHFGREEWQLHIAGYLLACGDNPALLMGFDCVGNRLSGDPSGWHAVSNDHAWGFGDYDRDFAPDGTLRTQDRRTEIRRYITTVGAGKDWPKTLSLQQPVPFDEPCLGIIGMWRQGGGANPYFALALGEIMARVGQRYIAWTAYERASKLADKYGWKPEHATFLREHSRRRQQEIEDKIPADEVPKLRPRFEAELAHGQQFHREYQEFEAKKIAAGVDLRDEHFFDEFYKDREPIATPVGESEWYARVDRDVVGSLQFRTKASFALLCGGIVAFAVVAFGRVMGWLRPRAKGSVLQPRHSDPPPPWHGGPPPPDARL